MVYRQRQRLQQVQLFASQMALEQLEAIERSIDQYVKPDSSKEFAVMNHGTDQTMTRRHFTTRQRMALHRRANGCCEECGCRIGSNFHADHRIPYAYGGPTEVERSSTMPTLQPTKTMKIDLTPSSLRNPATGMQHEFVCPFKRVLCSSSLIKHRSPVTNVGPMC